MRRGHPRGHRFTPRGRAASSAAGEQGIVLVTALLVLLAITALAFAGWLMSTMDLRVASNLRNESQDQATLHAGYAHATRHLLTMINERTTFINYYSYNATEQEYYWNENGGPYGNFKYRYRLSPGRVGKCQPPAQAAHSCAAFVIHVEALNADAPLVSRTASNTYPVASAMAVKEMELAY